MRLLIFLGIIYLCYRTLKSWLFQNSAVSKTDASQPVGAIDDVMFKDPVCEVYFPKRDGIHLQADGQDLYFCSTKCRDQFIASRSKK
jgi:YHS domain-containing protein